MTILKKVFFLNIAIFFISSEGFSQIYFDSKSISPSIIDSPLSKSSEDYAKEIEEIITLQQNIKKSELKKAALERNLTPEMIAQDVDLKLSRNDFPNLYNLLDRSRDTTRAITQNAKNYWKTARPFLADKRIKALIKKHDDWAYPSGHTASSFVTAEILSFLIPTKSYHFRERAKEIANHRVLVGMHFPHDLKGGRQLSLLIIGGLLQNEDFSKDLELARKELEEKYFEPEEE